MTRYHIVAKLNNETIGACPHEHRTRTVAAGCRWAPMNRVYTSLTVQSFEVPASNGPGRTRGQVSVTGRMYDRLKIEAEVRNMSISQIVEEAVQPALEEALGPTPATR